MRIILACIVSLILLAGCSSPRPEPVVATVGNETITLREYNRILTSATGSNAGGMLKTDVGRKQLLEDVIRGRLVLVAAKQAGIQNRPEVKKRIAQLRAELDDYFRMQSNEIIGKELVREQMLLADKEADAYYAQHKAELLKPVELNARQMLLGSEAQAQEILGRLHRGEEFAELAREFSKDKLSAARGGEMDCFGRGQCLLGRSFEEAAFALDKPRDVSAPVKGAQGYYLIQLVARRPAQAVSYDETMYRIRSMLKAEKYEEIVGALAKQIDVKVDDAVLSRAAVVPEERAADGLGASATAGKLE